MHTTAGARRQGPPVKVANVSVKANQDFQQVTTYASTPWYSIFKTRFKKIHHTNTVLVVIVLAKTQQSKKPARPMIITFKGASTDVLYSWK